MRRRPAAIVALALIAAVPPGSGAAAPARTPSPALAIRATNGLALGLLRHLGGTTNTVFSPYSVQTALAMVDQGAAGTTASVLDRLLGGASSPTALAGSENALAGTLKIAGGTRGPQLNNADGVWIRSGLPLEGTFRRTLTDDFGAGPHSLNFGSDPSAAAQAINAWVSQRTHGLIPALLAPDALSGRTAMVLANAIYLQASWSDPFDPSLTAPQSFSTAPGTTEETPFMSTSSDAADRMPYAHSSGWVAVGLPYAHSRLQMLAVMPALGSLGSFQSHLSLAELNRISRALTDQPLFLSMPKLSLRVDTDLEAPLAALGIGVAFSDRADFSQISPSGGLQITDIQHDAVLKLDEKGTVAAAATGVVVAPTAIAVDPGAIHVTLNHPFLLFLRDTISGAILFGGRVADPAAA